MLFNGTGGGGAARGATAGRCTSDRRHGRREGAADRAGRAALPAARRRGWRSSPTRWASASGSAARARGSRCTRRAGEMECVTFGDGVAQPAARGARRHRRPRRRRVRRGRPTAAGGTCPRRASCGSADGAAWVGVSTGGGGYGDPADRPAEQVARDVRDGIVVARPRRPRCSASSLRDDGSTVDEAATTAAREPRCRAIVRPASSRRRRPRRPGSSGTCATATSTS